ncbi:cytochrome b5-like heme/steroid binding domain-containing protein [Rhodotorula paludigena]|uniref:cytochrome b5-like heme/steroid binding domain-containing protein n=1 Tax=Rhodotorula paludigena TaxID=86838 RepID=UPI00317244AB
MLSTLTVSTCDPPEPLARSPTHSLATQGYLGLSSAPSPAAATPQDSIPSIVAEPHTTHVAFPALSSQQRARQPASLAPSLGAPSLSLSPPGAFGSTTDSDDADDQEGDDDAPALPEVRVEGGPPPAAAALQPPTTTTKVVKAPKGRVRVEKGFSQLDWARLNRSGEVDLRGGVTELRRITPAEMAEHNTRDDCWQAYGGKVYNVGPFLKFHPGGVGEMMRGAGKDVLAHAWVNYETLLENCLVGFLVRD